MPPILPRTVFALLSAASALATAPDIEERLDLLEAELRQLRTENASLRQAIDASRHEPQEAKIQPAGSAITHLTIGGFFHAQAEGLDAGDARFSSGNDRLYLRRARMNLTGALRDDFNFKLEFEVAGPLGETSNLRVQTTDAHVNWTRHRQAQIRFGQFKTPFAYEQISSELKQFTPEHALMIDRLMLGRQIGAQLSGDFFEKRLSYATGVFNGTSVNTNANDNDAFTWVGRLSGQPWHSTPGGTPASASVGINGYVSDDAAVGGQAPELHLDSVAGGPPDNIFAGNRIGAGIDTQIQLGRFDLWAEYVRVRFEPLNRMPASDFVSDGWYVQGSYFVLPKKLQALLKLDSFDPNCDVSGDSTDTLTCGLNWYIQGDDLKLMTHYLLSDAAQHPDERQQKIILRLQTLF